MIRTEAGMPTARFCWLIGVPERAWRRRTFSPGGSAGGLAMIDQTPSNSRTRKKRSLAQSLTRDTQPQAKETVIALIDGESDSGDAGVDG
ncbi:hypothetical protein [Kitasatospora purpeofusca]|uniref:hypothetical protein n=1 Tax=Kitasatospora purpeofusca TaxID=67352 RepID=UPI00225541F8|nr:hypothetical protein [Kitasatospora purpeofusca]MCX4752427.1 hypothetical protein [Kitasatospora purpeofusca]WSR32000.1 hypothetical protein OG715_14020 [Kitasatospora purpeofusca]